MNGNGQLRHETFSLMRLLAAIQGIENAMLAHENCRMRIMQQITGEMR